MFTVALLGKTNVGKTTLFNRLVGGRVAITHNSPGVTRDRKTAFVQKANMEIKLTDTAGLELATSHNELERKAFAQSLFALEEADLCLLVVDGRQGFSLEDEEFVKLIRKYGKPTIIVVNKCENTQAVDPDLELSLKHANLGSVVYVSAEHGIGTHKITDAMKPFYKKYVKEYSEDTLVTKTIGTNQQDKAFSFAVVGRPNAGKSTIINKILGEERLVTDKNPGTTRDSITVPIEHMGYTIHLVDTAGIRRKMKINNDLEAESVQESFRAIDMAHIVCLMIDITKPFDSQDHAIVQKITTEGRPIIVILNKADLISPKELDQTVKETRNKILSSDLQNITKYFFTTSALKQFSRENTKELLDEAIIVYQKWFSFLKTRELNDWLRELVNQKKPPIINKIQLKLKFINQKSSRPPTFAISSNFSEVPEEYVKFIKNRLCEDFALQGIPIRVLFKKASNPFIGGEKGKAKQGKKYK